MVPTPWAVSVLGALGFALIGFALAQGLASRLSRFEPFPHRPAPPSPPSSLGTPVRRFPTGLTLGLTAASALVLVCFLLGQSEMGLTLLFILLVLRISWRLGPNWLDQRKQAKKLEALREVFPQSLGMMIQALKAGQTLQQVLEYLSHECPEPLRSEYKQVCRDMALGAGTDQALGFVAQRYPAFDDFKRFIESYLISRITGANLTRLLEFLLENLQEKERLVRKREAMTAQARLSGTLMGLLPFLLGLVFFVMDPSLMTPLFTTPQGWAILITAILLESIGFLWIRQLLALEF
jgi:tight adherence protein B